MKKSKKAKVVKKAAPKKTQKAAKKTAPVEAVKKNALGTPYGDRILVKPQAAEATTSFGIIIPDGSKEKPEQGTVVAVGEGKMGQDGKVIAMRVKVGDRIMFSKYAFDEIKIDEEEYLILKEDTILAIIK